MRGSPSGCSSPSVTRWTTGPDSDVVAALGEALANDPRVDPLMLDLVRRQLNDRLAGYNEALIAKGGAAGTGERLGRVLLAFASDGARSAGAPLPKAVELLSAYMAEANAGAPHRVRGSRTSGAPSALGSGRAIAAERRGKVVGCWSSVNELVHQEPMTDYGLLVVGLPFEQFRP